LKALAFLASAFLFIIQWRKSMKVGVIVKKSFGITISMLLVISLILSSNIVEVAALGHEPKSDRVIITNESNDVNKTSSTGSFNLQEINEHISINEDLPMEAYKIDMNLRFDPEEVDAAIFNVSKNERRIPITVGSNKKFWVVDFRTNKDVPIDTKLLYSGKRSEVWVHNNEITTEQAKKMGEEFDNKVYPLVTENFAKESDVDGNGKVSLLVYDIQDGYDQSGTYTAGYFYSRDLYKTTHSNNAEVFYVDTYPTIGDKKSGYDVSKAFSTIAHEFQHMVSYNQNVLVEKGEEMETWLNEAMSMAAEHMYLNDTLRERLYYFERAPSIANGHSLLHWDENGDVLANYSLSYLFGQYLRIQLGQDNKVFKEILEKKTPTNQSLQMVLDERFNKSKSLKQFISDFRQALYENEQEGLYGFKGEKGLASIKTPLYTGNLPLKLRGGGSIVVPINDASKFVRPANAGETIDFRIIEYEDLDAIVPKKPRVESFSDIDEVLKGTAKPGSHIQVYKDKRIISDAYAEANGSFEINVGEHPVKTTLYITATDAKGNESKATMVEVTMGIVVEKNISRLSHIKTGKSFVYAKPSMQSSKKSSEEHKNRVYYVKKQATYKKEIYYLLSTAPSDKRGVIGWMRESDMTSYAHSTVDKERKWFYVLGTGGAGFDTAWGGSKNRVHPDLKLLKNERFSVDLTEKVGNETWYRGMLGGKQTWIHNQYITETNAYVEQSTSRLGHINSGKSDIYSSPISTVDKESSEEFKNSVYYIKKQATYNEELYYLLSNNPSTTSGVIGWMKASDVSSYPHVGMDKNEKILYVKGTGGAGYTRAWGGRKNYVYSDLKQFEGAQFQVNLTERVGSNVWYRGMLNGKQAWIQGINLAELSEIYKESSTSRLGHINGGKSSIYRMPYNQIDKESSEGYKNTVYYIKKQATFSGALYYLLSRNSSATTGTIGWMKASDISGRVHKGLDKERKNLYVKGNGGAGYDTAWGGSKNLTLTDLMALENELFKVDLTETVGNDIWYRGILAGKRMWILSSYLADISGGYMERSTSRLGHINSGKSDIYKFPYNVADKKSSEEFKNSVYYIKKQATYNEELYYLLSNNSSATNGVVGWMKASDVSSYPHVGVDKNAKTLYVKGTSGAGYDTAWGGSKNFVYPDLEKLVDAKFSVNLTERVGDNIWYRGQLNGKETWISSSFVKQ